MIWFYKLVAVILSLFIYSPVSEIASYSVEDEGTDLVFTVLSDVHIEGNNQDRFNLFGEGIRDINSNTDNDALIFLGDNTMNNQVVELSAFYSILNQYNTIDNVLMVTGNHDLCPSDYNTGDYEDLLGRFFKYKNEYIETQYDDSVYYSYEINGYKFIVLGSESDAGINEDLSDTQLTWLENELESVKESGNPVFIFNHYPLNNIWADVWSEGHIGDDSDRVYEILKNSENQILYFSGHLHMGFYEDKREVVYDDNVTFINVAGFGVDNTDGDADIQHSGTGQQVEVYDDEIVIRVRDFAKHEWKNIEYKVNIL